MKNQNANDTMKTGQGALSSASAQRRMPHTNAQKLMQRSAATIRSAIWPHGKGASSAPSAEVAHAQAPSPGENAISLRINENNGPHAPGTAYCRNISTDNLARMSHSVVALVQLI